MEYIDCEGYPKECQNDGFYFKPSNCQATHFAFSVDVIEKGSHAVVEIFYIGIPQKQIDCSPVEIIIENGAECKFYEHDLVMTIDLWNKYYFPKTGERLQLYYNENGKGDINLALSEVMSFSIKKGLSIAKIETY